ncbi:sensor histidine kinase [Bosea beijingensis]|uniref:sensor histidine kinase n=1 Tax=Bosea beijingensis TaxID=3068632 RepID=UPI0027421DB0|nr:PAS domain-containing protein [Bosea sp. REN20]
MEKRTWPVGQGEMAERLRGWTGREIALGPPRDWPGVLRNALQLVLLSPAAMTLLWGRQGLMLYNDAYAIIAGARHPANFGMSVFEAWPEVADFNRAVMDRVYAGDSPSYRDLPFVFYRNGAAEDVWLNVDYSPVLDEAGEVVGVLAIVTETTERMQAEMTLRRREAELAQVQKIGGVGGLEVDLRSGFRNRRSPEYLQIHGLPPEAVQETHEDWVRRIHPEDRATVVAHFQEAVQGSATAYQAEYRIIRPSDGQIRWIAATAQIERGESGEPLRLIGAHRDVTERKEAEAEQRLLMQELAHRVKNTMAMIQALASQTLRSAGTLEAARETFSARLAALARAHDLLVGGRRADATVQDIAQSIIALQGDPGRFRIAGEEVVLGPKAALALTLILHELTTNAVKYGALSNDTGVVSLSWGVGEIEGVRQFRLRWRESGGPQVAPPSRKGFGSRLIERSFPAARTGTASAYLPEGLVFTLDAPFDALGVGEAGV